MDTYQELKGIISEKARTGGRIELIKIMTGSKRVFDTEKMADQDWETFVDILRINQDRKVILNFLYNIPAILSMKLLNKLSKVSHQYLEKDKETIFKTLFNLTKNVTDSDFLSLQYLYVRELKSKVLIKIPNSITISLDSQILVETNNRTIRLWNISNGKHYQTLSGHTDCVHSIAISPNGKILISSSYDKSIRLWRLPDGKHINTIDMSKYCHNGKGTQPKPIQISPDSSHAFFNSINFLSCT